MRRFLPLALVLGFALPASAASTWNIGTSAGNKQVLAASIGESDGNHAILNGWIGTSAGNKQFYASLSASASPSSVSASGSTMMHTFSNASTCAAAGGSGSYSYAWTIDSSSGGTWAFTAGQATATPSVQVTGAPSGGNASIHCAATDASTGATANSNTVSLSYTVTGP